MNQCKVSIITICYNCKADLEKTILSVKGQNYKNKEYLVIDGGSSDGTREVLEKYSYFITKYICESDKGIYDAMNKGIGLSSGNWVSFMNAGDEFADAYVLDRIFTVSYNKQTKVLYGDIQLYFPCMGLIRRKYSKYSQDEVPVAICHQASFIEGNIIRRLRYDLKYKIASDINTFFKIYKEGWNFQYLNMDVAKFEAVGGVSSKRIIAVSSEIYEIIGRSKYSWGWIGCLIRGFIKQLMMKIMGENAYSKYQYNRLVKKYKIYQ